MDFELKLVIKQLNEFFTLFLVFPAIILIGTYLTIKLKFLQITKLRLSLRYLLSKRKVKLGGISNYQAVAGILAGNFGTGNISGMAIALTTGGPGSLVWMWVMAFFGAAIQYTSCTLATKYRLKNAKGEYIGGPMYYLRDGLKKNGLAALFALSAIAGAITCGNFVQVNSLVLPLAKYGINPLYVALGMSAILGFVIVGGIQRFAKVASSLVPIMASFYLIAALIIITFHFNEVPKALSTIFHSAFSISSLFGGTMGYGVFKAITTGFDRGLFATDAGTGLVPVIQASADSNHPVVSGVVTVLTPFLVMLLCTITALVLMVTNVWTDSGLLSTDLCALAFEKGLAVPFNVTSGGWIVIVSLFLFAVTTILAWSVCAERAVEFLFGSSIIKYFRYFFIAMIPVGAVMHVDMVWLVADLSISMMLITNMIGIVGLSRGVIVDSRTFFAKQLV
ncbi:MAG: sodium:alanine symporter family protein [Parachlamydiales bacterium]|nr:sodium:alanine symporter family protein [Parachlamydiales bacterium]